jgi:hypothetical protein
MGIEDWSQAPLVGWNQLSGIGGRVTSACGISSPRQEKVEVRRRSKRSEGRPLGRVELLNF